MRLIWPNFLHLPPGGGAKQRSLTAAKIENHVHLVAVLQFKRFTCIVRMNSFTAKEKPQGHSFRSLTHCIRIHDFNKFGALLNFEHCFFHPLDLSHG